MSVAVPVSVAVLASISALPTQALPCTVPVVLCAAGAALLAALALVTYLEYRT